MARNEYMRLRTPVNVTVLIVTVSMVLAGSLVVVTTYVDSAHPGPTPPSVGNGLTYYQASSEIDTLLTNVTGGPWHLASILGIATEVPVAPLPAYNTSLNQTLALCYELDGTTIWNASAIPIFTGSLASGAAPFWSLLFRNGTGSYLYATNIEGSVRVYGPSSVVQSCVDESGIGEFGEIDVPSIPNTVSLALDAYRAAGSAFALKESPLTEYYSINLQISWLPFNNYGWTVGYLRCDLVGVSGYQNFSAVGFSPNGTQFSTMHGYMSCTNPDYGLSFGNVTINSSESSNIAEAPFQVTMSVNGTTNYDGSGLQSWMTTFNLTAPTGTILGSAPATCAQWVSSLSDCPSNSNGWFLVLLSPDGGWLDSYPSTTSSSAWNVPNVILSSHDELCVVVPSSWDIAGDLLHAANTPQGPGVTGSVSL